MAGLPSEFKDGKRPRSMDSLQVYPVRSKQGSNDRNDEILKSTAFPGDLSGKMNHRSQNSGSNDLQQKLEQVLNENPIGLQSEKYLPDDQYDNLFRPDVVARALGGLSIHSPLVCYTLENGKKTFATLVLVLSTHEDRRDAMNAFMAQGFTDETLETLTGRMSSSGNFSPAFPKSRPWTISRLEVFEQKRWRFLVPLIDSVKFRHYFHQRQILPFLSKNSPISDGHFSSVQKVIMLACKQNRVIIADKTIPVALKTLKPISDHGYNIKDEWEREAKALERMNGKGDHIIQAYGAYQVIGESPEETTYHFVLEWANGGNLKNFLSHNTNPLIEIQKLSDRRLFIMDMLRQLLGLAGALEEMHSTTTTNHTTRSEDLLDIPVAGRTQTTTSNSRGEALEDISLPTMIVSRVDGTATVDELPKLGSTLIDSVSQSMTSPKGIWRHGDIKPENILRFTDEGDSETTQTIGTLKLADLGRAQQHQFATRYRDSNENEDWRTRWYEPPDLQEQVHQKAGGKISRLFDIWSMGCVIFECTLWLLYGHDSINQFVTANNLFGHGQSSSPYWRKRGTEDPAVSETATTWMNHILENDPESRGAIGDLVRLVKDRLIQVLLPEDSDIYTPGYRTNAKDLKEQLKFICDKSERDEVYLFSGVERTNVSHPSDPTRSNRAVRQSSAPNVSGKYLSAPSAGSHGRNLPIFQPTAIARQREYTNRMSDDWSAIPDEEFRTENSKGREFPDDNPDLCHNCKEHRIMASKNGIDMDQSISNPQDESCDLCELICAAIKNLNLKPQSKISLKAQRDTVVWNAGGQEIKVLRLFCKRRGK